MTNACLAFSKKELGKLMSKRKNLLNITLLNHGRKIYFYNSFNFNNNSSCIICSFSNNRIYEYALSINKLTNKPHLMSLSLY